MHLKAMIKVGEIFKEERQPLIQMVETIYDMELNPSYYLNLLPDYLSEIRISSLIKAARTGKMSNMKAAQEIKKTLESPRNNGIKGVIMKPLEVNFIGDAPVETVPTGISAIDSRMYGGLGLGEFGIVCGISGLGKTTLAMNFCWGAAKLGYSAHLITLELPGKKIAERLYSRITEIQYNRVRQGDMGEMDPVKRDVWDVISGLEPRARDKFTIWDLSEESCTIQDIDAYLGHLEKEGQLPKMVFLDWLDALDSQPMDRRGGVVNREIRHVLQSFSEGCSNLAKKYNIAFWATTQSNASGDNKKTIRMGNVAEGFSKNWRCSVFLGIGATDEDREIHNRVRVTASKMRDGMIFSTDIEARLDVQRFADLPEDVGLAPDMANFVPVGENGDS